MSKLFLIGLALSVLMACSKEQQPLVIGDVDSLLPTPQKLQKGDKHFKLNPSLTVYCASEALKSECALLTDVLSKAGYKVKLVDQQPNDPFIGLELNKATSQNSDESYHLQIDAKQVLIEATSPQGVFRGMQSLCQLIPALPKDQPNKLTRALPEVDIIDYPHFAWRGMLLDCCRHFFSKEIIKKYIDLLAYYKMNILHWHLTEDQGWRLAIEQYPRLTSVAAWRTEDDSTIYGGFYTQSDVREIVAYAKQRHITVVPEIEMPGHSQAAIAAYPYLSCTGDSVAVATKWGVFKEVYCAGNEQTFEFLQHVLKEVFELFPDQYIHIGGDECPKFRWQKCAKCQKRMQDEKLEDEAALQSYFIKRIAAFLEQNNKKLIGWDEILEGGLAQNAIVQSWRGMQGAKEAALLGQQAIVSPTSHAYFDYDLQAIDLQKVYAFDPIPTDLSSEKRHLIIGGECNMWTEWVPDEKTLDSKVFPRLLAMTEVLWTYPSVRDYEAFYKRVQLQYPFLESKAVQYGAETIPVKADIHSSQQSIHVKLEKASPDLRLKYSFADSVQHDYEGAFALRKSGILRVQAYKNDNAYGPLFERQFVKHLANGIQPQLSYEFSPFYTGGGQQALTNGIRGTLDFRDGNWQAVQKESMEISIDLGKSTSIRQLSAAFYQKQDSWIFLPEEVLFYVATDTNNFRLVSKLVNNISPKRSDSFIKEFETTIPLTEVRYVKMMAKNIEQCPEWHAAPGSDAWLFIDEFVVE